MPLTFYLELGGLQHTGSGDFTIKLWDLDTWQEVRRFEGHSGTVYALALSGDGERILMDASAILAAAATISGATIFENELS